MTPLRRKDAESLRTTRHLSSIVPMTYDAARETVLARGYGTGKIGLCRSCSIEGRIITDATHSEYTHALLFGWNGANTLMMGETRESHDARLISAGDEVREYPGYYDIYSVPLDYTLYDADKAWDFICHAAGSQYSYRHLSRAWLRRRLGRWIPPIPNSNSPRWPRDCSALVHAALRVANGPQVDIFDCDVSPGDLPKILVYEATLFTTPNEVLDFQDLRAEILSSLKATQ